MFINYVILLVAVLGMRPQSAFTHLVPYTDTQHLLLSTRMLTTILWGRTFSLKVSSPHQRIWKYIWSPFPQLHIGKQTFFPQLSSSVSTVVHYRWLLRVHCKLLAVGSSSSNELYPLKVKNKSFTALGSVGTIATDFEFFFSGALCDYEKLCCFGIAFSVWLGEVVWLFSYFVKQICSITWTIQKEKERAWDLDKLFFCLYFILSVRGKVWMWIAQIIFRTFKFRCTV